VRANLCFKAGGNIYPARSRIYILLRAKKAVGLQHQLAAQAVLVVDDQLAEDALRRPILVVMPKDVDAAGKKSSRDRFSSQSG
jgi:hypothetical protein